MLSPELDRWKAHRNKVHPLIDNHLFMEVRPMAGTSIEDAAKELIDLRNILGINLETRFNGFTILVSKNTAQKDIVNCYRDWLAEDHEEFHLQ